MLLYLCAILIRDKFVNFKLFQLKRSSFQPFGGAQFYPYKNGGWTCSKLANCFPRTKYVRGILTGYYMGYTLIWVLSTSDTYHITNE